MSIEIRNFNPANNEENVSIYKNMDFNIVSLDDYKIDIESLVVTVTTTSIIDEEEHTLTYTYFDNEVTAKGSESTFYNVFITPKVPFEYGLTVTVDVNVSGTTNLNEPYVMPEYSLIFRTAYNGLISDFRNVFISHAERIPVYNEILKKNSTSTPQIFDSAFKKWNMVPTPKIQLNQIIIDPDDTTYGYTIDYENGKIKFNSPLQYNDTVDATYTFSFFTDEQINGYFDKATQIWNMHPPFGGAPSIYSAGAVVGKTIMVGAASFAFMDILMSLAFQETRLIFDNASWGDGWREIKNLFKELADFYKEMWKDLLEAKKTKLPSMSIVVMSEFSLPGGRSRMFRYMYK